jgi:hypothetical protein
MSGQLPRWETPDKRRREALKAWTNARLDEERIARSTAAANKAPNNTVPITQWLAMLAAWHGKMEPLRALHPDLAPYLHPRKRGRGEHKGRARGWAIQQAVADVARIRAVWKANFRKWKRSDGLAVELAAERWKLDEDDLVNALRETSGK